MNYKEYLNEAIDEKSKQELQKIFNEGLLEVFSSNYLNQISSKLKDFLSIEEVEEESNVVAYNVGTKIYVNKNEFYNYSSKAQARYLLHEFIHVLQRKRGIILSKFKDIRKLTNDIYKVLKKNMDQPISVFLTGKNQDLGKGGKWEVLSYFMNNSMNWKVLDDNTKKEVVSLIKNSGIFNTESPFWRRRLPY